MYPRFLLFGSFSYLQGTRTYISSLTSKLAALECRKIDVSTFCRLILIRSLFNLQVTRICIISWIGSNFGHIGPPTTELAAIERLKYPQRLIMEENGVSTFSQLFWSVPSDTFRRKEHELILEFEFPPDFIRITCPCDLYPLSPYFYIVKMGYTGLGIHCFCSKT